VKQGDALSLLLFNFTSDYAIRRIRVKQEALKLNGAHQVLVYADDVNISGRSIRTTNEYTDALRFDNKGDLVRSKC
jgi:pyrimidine operon attenuation protein/uracil phosphoribosyltransferase